MSTVKNFGFMWDREKVEWGRRGKGGSSSLMGVRVGDRKRQVDFADQMGNYVLYDRFEEAVQIGQSQAIFRRLRQHRKDHLRNRWSWFSWFGFYKVGKNNNKLLVREQAGDLRRILTLQESLNELEAILIQVLEPRLNRRGSNWVDAEEYLQIPMTNEIEEDDDVDGEED